MITRWTRLTNPTLCGGCAKYLAPGSAVQMNQLRMVKREQLRGECCAGVPPPDLPALVETAQRKTSGDFSHIGTSIPKRTRGGLRQFVADRWQPYKEAE